MRPPVIGLSGSNAKIVGSGTLLDKTLPSIVAECMGQDLDVQLMGATGLVPLRIVTG